MTTFFGHHRLHTFLSSSNFQCSPKPKPLKCFPIYAAIPARDSVIDFGKYKGRMLGTLPSTYLKWVSNNLRARDFEEWAKLADQVVQDPVYNDRLEWEFAEKFLNGDVLAANSKSEGTAVAELLEISQRFGWDNDDKQGWSKVDFKLLGTSKGGRIPRLKEKKESKHAKLKITEAENDKGLLGGVKERRVERRMRSKMRRGIMPLPNLNDRRLNISVGADIGHDNEGSCDQTTEVYNPFPGRETLLQKALSQGRINHQQR